jgi:hypothetical protein
MRLRNLLILLALLAPLTLAPASPAATVAGTNGKIAYSDGTNVWLMNSDGTGATQLTSAAGANIDPALSPDGTKVAFASSRFGGWDIMVANVDGSGTFRLTSNPVTWEQRPAWSPDGNALVYQVYDPTVVGPNWDLYTMQKDGTGQTALSSNDAAADDMDPSFAPDGGSIVYTSSRSGGFTQIWTAGADGSNAYQLIFSGENDCQPTFSPDSRAIAYTAFCSSGASQIKTYFFSAAIKTITAGFNDREPSWSPDGQQIAFARTGVGIATRKYDGTGLVTSLGPLGATEPDWGANLANVGLPRISGGRTVGDTVVAGSGSWLGQGPITYAYQWMRCNAAGDGCQTIGGATGLSYQLTNLDVSGTIRLQVTATNPSGSAQALSPGIGSILLPPGPDIPSISGLPVVGTPLSATTGSVGAALGLAPVTYTFQWLRCDTTGLNCVAIAGATNPLYVLVTADSQRTIRVTVNATNTSGSATGTSLATEVIGGLVPTNSVLPVIAGQPVVGRTLTASTGTWVGGAGIAYGFQWERCNAMGTGCLQIPGASASTYVVTLDDVASSLVASVTATNANGIASVPTDPSAIVGTEYSDPGAGTPGSTIAPRILGETVVGSTLTVSSGGFVGTDLTYAYQWQRCNTSGTTCAPIGGAGTASYRAVQPDVGSTIRVFVTASNDNGSATGVSEVTSAVVAASASNSSSTGTASNARRLVLTGTGRADRLVVSKGKTRIVAGAGNDTIFAADGRREVVDCGAGRDTVTADRIDVVVHCERVVYPTKRVATK